MRIFRNQGSAMNPSLSSNEQEDIVSNKVESKDTRHSLRVFTQTSRHVCAFSLTHKTRYYTYTHTPNHLHAQTS